MAPKKRLSARLALVSVAVAVASWVAVIVVTASAFDRVRPHGYRWHNHVISELGFPLASNCTWVFDVGLALGSWLLLPVIILLSRHLNTLNSRRALRCGVLICAANSLIGWWGLPRDLFPGPYDLRVFLIVYLALAALAGIVWQEMITRFAVDTWRMRRRAGGFALAVLCTVAAAAGPLICLWAAPAPPAERAFGRSIVHLVIAGPWEFKGMEQLSDWLDFAGRPPVWRQAIGEWILVWTMIGWHFAVALVLNRHENRAAS